MGGNARYSTSGPGGPGPGAEVLVPRHQGRSPFRPWRAGGLPKDPIGGPGARPRRLDDGHVRCTDWKLANLAREAQPSHQPAVAERLSEGETAQTRASPRCCRTPSSETIATENRSL